MTSTHGKDGRDEPEISYNVLLTLIHKAPFQVTDLKILVIIQRQMG